MENNTNLLTHADFFDSKACNHIKGLEELNNMRADLSEKDTVNLTSIFKGMAQMILKGGKTLQTLFDEDEIITDLSEIEGLVNDACDDIINKDLEAAIANDKKELAMGIRRYMRFEQHRERMDSDDWKIVFNKSLFVTSEFFPLLDDIIPQVKGSEGISTSFDVIFINEKEKMIEGVKYKGGEAWLSSAPTAKRKTEDDKWMNIMLKALETLVPENETYVVKTSYYHLRPKQVRRDQGVWEFIEFDKNSSIVSLEEEFCNSEAFKSIPTAQDTIIKEDFLNFEEGKECSDDDCKNCILNCSCHFIKTPEEMEEKEVKKGKKPNPSEAQQVVIDWDKGALSVIAGAGAGKTECASEHMNVLIIKEASAYVTAHPGVTLEHAVKEILPRFFMTTFTNAGVIEMKERMIGKLELEGITIDMDDLNVMTFNTFAYNIDKKYYEELGFSKEPTVIDEIRKKKIIIDLLNENPITGLNNESALADTPNCRGSIAVIAKSFEIVKKTQLDIGDFSASSKLGAELGYSYTKYIDDGSTLDQILDLYSSYEEELLEDGLITFEDQEPMALKMLEIHPEYLEELGYKHIVVDEFQDSNDIQMEFVKLLCNTSSYTSLVVVGDDFQAIYGFRDTSPENMIHFPEKFGQEVNQHFLVDNYRSVPEVIAVSNQFIKNNVGQIPKDLVAFRPSEGKPVVVRGFYDNEEEDETILSVVKKKLEEGYLPEDICIITGTNAEITRIGAKLADADLPIVMKNPQKYMDNSRVKAAIKLANAVWDPNCTENYFPYLVAKFNGDLVKEYTPDEILEMIEEVHKRFIGFENLEYGYQRKIYHDLLEEIKGNDEIFQSFIDMLIICEDFPSELDFIQDFKKYGYTAAVRMNQMYQGIVLVTAHSSKGLEWPVVINTLDGYDTAVMHGNKSAYIKKQIEEKRRLAYVSMTRARNELFVFGKYNIAEEASSKGVVIPATQNIYLKEVFDIVDPTGYIPVDPNKDYKKQIKKESAEAKKAEREKRKIARQSQAILAKYHGDKKAMIKDSKEANAKPYKGKGARPMTDAEIYEYNEKIKNAKQVSIQDLGW